MAYARVQSATAYLATSGGTTTVTLGTAATAGNLLVGTVNAYPVGSTVTPPTGFTLLGRATGNSASGDIVFYSKIAAGGETAFVWGGTGTGEYSEFFVTEYSGNPLAVAIDGTVLAVKPGAGVTSITMTYGSAPVAAGELVIAAYSTTAGTASTTPSGWNQDWEVLTSDDSVGIYWQSSTTTAPTGTFTWTTSSTASGGMVVIKAASVTALPTPVVPPTAVMRAASR